MTDTLKRGTDENLLQWQIRIYRNRKVYNLTDDDVADLFNKETGENKGESAWRKFFAAFTKGYDFAVENNIDHEERMLQLLEKEKEVEKKIIQFRDIKREQKNYLRHEGRLDNLLQTMIDSIMEDVQTNKPLHWFNEVSPTNSKQAGILLLSDLHKGLNTKNYWNEYNDSVFYDRLNKLTNKVIEYKSKHDLDELHIMQLGDLIHGVLHRLTRVGDTEDAVRSTQSVAEALAEMVAKLANHYPKIVFRSVKGNHDRVASRKEEEIKTESFHDFVPWYMRARLSHFENVVFEDNIYDDEIIVADILGHTYFGVHGHLEGYAKVVHDLTMMIQKFPTAVVAGHIHKNFENEIHGVDLIVNGGFAGTDEYAKDKRLLSKAHQKFIIVDEYGRKSQEYIRLK